MFSAPRLLLALFASCIALASCSDDEPSVLSLLGESCQLNSDCEGGLACVYGSCREECAVSSDCEAGRCVLGPNKLHFCQPSGLACSFHSDCLEPLVCARDGQCRNECAADRDCVAGQLCTSATCADPDELDETGELPSVGDPVGKPCNYASDCGLAEGELKLACRDGSCTYACFEERDCGRFFDCTTADEPDKPGNCELIGDPDKLFCDPDDGEMGMCVCDGAPMTMVPCLPDGSGYDCQCDAN